MNKLQKSLLISVIQFLLILMFPLNVTAVGLGVGPTNIEISDALRGGEYLRTISIKYIGEGQAIMELSVTGDISDWVTFYEHGELTTPVEHVTAIAGEWTYAMVQFSIPDNAPVGNTTGTIYVNNIPPEGDGDGGVTVGLQGKVDVNIIVTGTQILTGVVNSVTARDTEVGYPLRVEVQFRNTGNVVATPQIDIEITKDDASIDNLTFAETKVNPEKSEAIPVEWDTDGRELGDYAAHVAISLDEEVIATGDLDFAILPVGTLTRFGEFIELAFEGEPKLGTITKVQATFSNSGFIDTKAKFIGELYCDNELIDTLESEETLVPVGQSDILISYVMPEKQGDYDVKGYINYEGKETEVKEISFSIGEAGGGHSFNWLILTVTVIAILAGVIAYMVIRRKRGKPA
jgi:hypothetical protein